MANLAPSIAGLIFALVLPLAASALPITQAASAFGPGTITRDHSTGLDWLDLTVTQARSFNDVSADLLPGGPLAGFRYGLVAEMEALLTGFGISLPSALPSLPNGPPTGALIGLLGATFQNTASDYACGVHGSGFSAGATGTFHNTACLVASDVGGQWIPFYDVQNDAERGRRFTGSWLVRTSPVAVPEPRTALLFVAAALAATIQVGRSVGWKRPRCVSKRHHRRRPSGLLAPAVSFAEVANAATPPGQGHA